jgi:hypothetical protein
LVVRKLKRVEASVLCQGGDLELQAIICQVVVSEYYRSDRVPIKGLEYIS